MTRSYVVPENIDYDLAKIVEPWDGILQSNQSGPVYHLIKSYFLDLKYSGMIKEFSLRSSSRQKHIVYDINVRFTNDKTKFKKFKVYVSTFQYPWTTGGKQSKRVK